LLFYGAALRPREAGRRHLTRGRSNDRVANPHLDRPLCKAALARAERTGRTQGILIGSFAPISVAETLHPKASDSTL
jgi:hypothetical protein